MCEANLHMVNDILCLQAPLSSELAAGKIRSSPRLFNCVYTAKSTKGSQNQIMQVGKLCWRKVSKLCLKGWNQRYAKPPSGAQDHKFYGAVRPSAIET